MVDEFTSQASMLESAIALHQQGALHEAIKIYRQILAQQPSHHDALHLLGAIYYQQQNYTAAIEYIEKAIATGVANPHFHNNLGLCFVAQKRYQQALQHYRRATTLQPNFVEALHNIGHVASLLNDTESAQNAYLRAIELNPDCAQSHYLYATCLFACGRSQAAATHMDQALALQPNWTEAYIGYAQAIQQQHPTAAITLLEKALRLDPNDTLAHYNLGLLLLRIQHYDTAERHLRRAIELSPQHSDALNNLGLLYHQTDRLDLAIDCFRQALQFTPHDCAVMTNYAISLMQVDQYAAAHTLLTQALRANPNLENCLVATGECCEKMGLPNESIQSYLLAVNANPQQPRNHYNLANALRNQLYLELALVYYAKAIALDANFHLAQWNRALTLLLNGNYTEGWQAHEARLHIPQLSATTLHTRYPRWDGTRLDREHLLIWAEQGLGDTIQFIRYLPKVRAIVKTITVACPANLLALFKPLSSTADFIDINEPLPENKNIALQIPLMSLAYLFHNNDQRPPTFTPYLPAHAYQLESFNEAVKHASGLKVGIVWSGNPNHHNDTNRSIPLESLAPLFNVKNTTFFSLQVGPAAKQLHSNLLNRTIKDCTTYITDFSDTAAIINCLDLVISVDTAVAHLAAALCKPTFVLLPYCPDWRWLLRRDETPWYPSMRLYRQITPGDWNHPIQSVIDDLETMCSESGVD